MLETIQSLWSALSLQITEHVTIDLGNLPSWIVALVAAGGFWKSWKAEKSAKIAVTKIEEVRHETNSMRAALEASKYKDGKIEGRAQVHAELAEAKELVRTDAIADAHAAADVRAAEMPNQTKTPT